MERFSMILVLLKLMVMFSYGLKEEDFNIHVNIQPYIIDGEVSVGTYPWIANIRPTRDSQSICGGTVIAPRFILTAAHCVKGFEEQIKYVAIGNYPNGYSTPDKVIYTISKIMAHPSYTAKGILDRDFALIELDESLPSYIKPVLLSHTIFQDLDSSKPATILGWGQVRNGKYEIGSNTLNELRVNIMKTSECNQLVKRYLAYDIHPTMVCVKSLRKYSGACSGDSGGPLVLNKESSRPILVGAASFVVFDPSNKETMCASGLPDVYARISSVRLWIDKYSSGHEWST